jgi:hypothetical protein
MMLKLCAALLLLIAAADGGGVVYKMTLPNSMWAKMKDGDVMKKMEFKIAKDGKDKTVVSVFNKADWGAVQKAAKEVQKIMSAPSFKIIIPAASFKIFESKGAFRGIPYKTETDGKNVNVIFTSKALYDKARKSLEKIQQAANKPVYKINLDQASYDFFQKKGAFKAIKGAGNGGVEKTKDGLSISFADKAVYEKVMKKLNDIKEANKGKTEVTEWKLMMKKSVYEAFKKKGVFKDFSEKGKTKKGITTLVFKDKANYLAAVKALEDAGATLNNNDKKGGKGKGGKKNRG